MVQLLLLIMLADAGVAPDGAQVPPALDEAAPVIELRSEEKPAVDSSQAEAAPAPSAIRPRARDLLIQIMPDVSMRMGDEEIKPGFLFGNLVDLTKDVPEANRRARRARTLRMAEWVTAGAGIAAALAGIVVIVNSPLTTRRSTDLSIPDDGTTTYGEFSRTRFNTDFTRTMIGMGVFSVGLGGMVAASILNRGAANEAHRAVNAYNMHLIDRLEAGGASATDGDLSFAVQPLLHGAMARLQWRF